MLAYEVLSDAQKRQIYDRHGEVCSRCFSLAMQDLKVGQEGLKAHEGGHPHHANPFDMFSSFFGSGGRVSIEFFTFLPLNRF